MKGYISGKLLWHNNTFAVNITAVKSEKYQLQGNLYPLFPHALFSCNYQSSFINVTTFRVHRMQMYVYMYIHIFHGAHNIVDFLWPNNYTESVYCYIQISEPNKDIRFSTGFTQFLTKKLVLQNN